LKRGCEAQRVVDKKNLINVFYFLPSLLALKVLSLYKFYKARPNQNFVVFFCLKIEAERKRG